MYNCTLLDKKILGRGVSDSLSVAFSTDFKKIIVHGCTIRWQHYVLSNNFNTSNIWHWYCRRKHADFYVGVWTITPLFAPNGSVIAAVFTPTWGPVELDLSPWDSPKGFCNLGCVSGGGEYCGHTSRQRYLTNTGSNSILTRNDHDNELFWSWPWSLW
jgi:hypothetical protein